MKNIILIFITFFIYLIFINNTTKNNKIFYQFLDSAAKYAWYMNSERKWHQITSNLISIYFEINFQYLKPAKSINLGLLRSKTQHTLQIFWKNEQTLFIAQKVPYLRLYIFKLNETFRLKLIQAQIIMNFQQFYELNMLQILAKMLIFFVHFTK